VSGRVPRLDRARPDPRPRARSPKELLDYRKWQRIRAREIIHLTVSIAGQLPAPLMQTIVRHPFDPKVVSKLTGRPVKLAPMKA
jgi:hypothetical protein